MEVTDADTEILTRLAKFISPLLGTIERRYHRDLALDYVKGLLGPGERKTVEPIVRRMRGGVAPARERDTREMLNEDWSHASFMWQGVERLLEQTDGWRAWTVDDTSLIKQGEHSVGVANQYAGCVGGLANCQVLVTLGIAQDHVSSPCEARLFLPEKWAGDTKRRNECHVPSKVGHVPKWKLALKMIEQIELRGLPRLPVLADSAYGGCTDFRRALDERGLLYVVGVGSSFTFVRAGVTFTPPPSGAGKTGRPRSRLVADGHLDIMDVEACARTLGQDAFRDVVWRIGSKGEQRGRFAAIRVRPAGGIKGERVRPQDLQPEQWLLMHWPSGEPNPTKTWLSNLPQDTSLEELIALARLRWRVERDYREGKGLLGLDHFEGRTWSGLHHHAALVVVAQLFLATERWRAIKDALRTVTEKSDAAQAATPPSASRQRGLRRAEYLRNRASAATTHRPRHAAMPNLRSSTSPKQQT